MALDVTTLSLAAMLVMAVSVLALFANWGANRLVDGLLPIAVGFAFAAFGTCIIFENKMADDPLAFLLGELLIVAGYAFLWRGIAIFWQMRSRRLVIVSWGMLPISFIVLLAVLLDGGTDTDMEAVRFLFVSLLSFGAGASFLKALGGHQGLYKGIVRRATVGAAIAHLLFIMHACYAAYLALPIFNMVPQNTLWGQPVAVISHIEAMIFAISLALVVIIMTAERLQAELKVHEMMDPLTKALNQRAFMEVVKAVLARARRNAEPVSLIMMDINKFKAINTKYGRLAGDNILAQFANIVLEGRRGQDVFCRFSGEEFVLLMPGTAEEGTALVVSRIRHKIETTTLGPEGTPIQLTVSMGAVTARGDDLEADGMLDVVNRQMYHDQKLQFNLIESAS